MSFYVGLDLGQQSDYTAVCVIEKLTQTGTYQRPTPSGAAHKRTRDTLLHVRHLQRFPLGTLYPEIVESVRELCASPELAGPKRSRPELVVDGTGVGVAVTDMLKEAGLSFFNVVITGGHKESRESGTYRVPKRNLVGALQVSLQNERLKIASSLELAGTLKAELLNFKVKVDPKTAHDSYEHWREGDHDDLVLAAALACWATQRRRAFVSLRSY